MFNFLTGWVGSGVGSALDLLMYGATLIMLLEVCRIASAYHTFPYEKSDEAVKAILSALHRAPGNPIGPWIRQIDE